MYICHIYWNSSKRQQKKKLIIIIAEMEKVSSRWLQCQKTSKGSHLCHQLTVMNLMSWRASWENCVISMYNTAAERKKEKKKSRHAQLPEGLVMIRWSRMMAPNAFTPHNGLWSCFMLAHVRTCVQGCAGRRLVCVIQRWQHQQICR